MGSNAEMILDGYLDQFTGEYTHKDDYTPNLSKIKSRPYIKPNSRKKINRLFARNCINDPNRQYKLLYDFCVKRKILPESVCKKTMCEAICDNFEYVNFCSFINSNTTDKT